MQLKSTIQSSFAAGHRNSIDACDQYILQCAVSLLVKRFINHYATDREKGALCQFVIRHTVHGYIVCTPLNRGLTKCESMGKLRMYVGSFYHGDIEVSIAKNKNT